MTEDEQKRSDTPAEGSDAQPAGPVEDEGSSSSQAAGDDPSSTPPAGDTSEGQPQDDAQSESAEIPAAAAEESVPETSEDAPQDEAAAEEPVEAPAAAQEEREPKPAEKKKDVIPGADLEPIAVEPEERPLSAEEQARREAEEEERRQREAALVGETEEEPSAASRAPAKIEGDSRFLATGKRKHAIARVILLPGNGKIEINKRPLEEFFPRPLHQTIAKQPLTTTGYEGNVDVRVRVHGGGVSGQAGAVRHGIARALTEVDPELRSELKRRGFLTRDARVKERRKAGLKKARKRPQFSKR